MGTRYMGYNHSDGQHYFCQPMASCPAGLKQVSSYACADGSDECGFCCPPSTMGAGAKYLGCDGGVAADMRGQTHYYYCESDREVKRIMQKAPRHFASGQDDEEGSRK